MPAASRAFLLGAIRRAHQSGLQLTGNGDTRNHVMRRGGFPTTAAVGLGGTPAELAVSAVASSMVAGRVSDRARR